MGPLLLAGPHSQQHSLPTALSLPLETSPTALSVALTPAATISGGSSQSNPGAPLALSLVGPKA